MESQEPVPALTRGLELIHLLGRDGPATLEGLAQKTGWPRSSLLRLLACLQSRRVVDRDPQSKRFRATQRLVAAEIVGHPLPNLLPPVLFDLARSTSLTAEWFRFNNGLLAMADRCEPEQSEVRIVARIGHERNLAEVDSLTLTVLAFGIPSNLWPDEPWQWRDDVRIPVSADVRARLVDEMQVRRFAADQTFNKNGVRRISTPVFGGAGFAGAISLAMVRSASIPSEANLEALLRSAADHLHNSIGATHSHSA